MAKKFYYHGKKPSAPKADEAPRYPEEKLVITLENLSVTPKTAELLAKYGVNTAGDLTKRTERDMFRVQGFNKKMLFELKDALKTQDMTFKPEPAPAVQDEQKAEPAGDNPRQNDRRNGNQDRNANSERRNDRGNDRRNANQPSNADGRNGNNNGRRDDRRDRNGKPQQQQQVKKPIEKPEKLTEPLSVPDWRKIQKGGKWGFFDGFKTVIPAMYDEVFCFKDGLASVELDEKCGYIDSENNIVIPFDYDTAMSFSEGYASVCKGDKCGYIDKENTVIIPFIYDAATAFEGGEAKVKQGGKWGTITPDGAVKWI